MTLKDCYNNSNLPDLCGFLEFRETVSSEREKLICQRKIAKPMWDLEEVCEPKMEMPSKLSRIEAKYASAKKKEPLLKKGDRIKLIKNYSYRIGVNSEGIVCRDIPANCYMDDSVLPIDFLRIHDNRGEVSKDAWNQGHDCDGYCSKRNGRYYGYWIPYNYIKKISGVSDDDILLLI